MAYDIGEVSAPCMRSVRSRFSFLGSSISLGDGMAAVRYTYGTEVYLVCDFLIEGGGTTAIGRTGWGFIIKCYSLNVVPQNP